MAVQITLDFAPLTCTYPFGWPPGAGCGRPATRTVDTGAAVVGACDAHQRSPWWHTQEAAAYRALAEARRGWMAPEEEKA